MPLESQKAEAITFPAGCCVFARFDAVPPGSSKLFCLLFLFWYVVVVHVSHQWSLIGAKNCLDYGWKGPNNSLNHELVGIFNLLVASVAPILRSPRSLKPKGGSTGGILVRKRGFLVLTGMPRPVLRESCTTSLKDFAIFPHKKNPFCGYLSHTRILMQNFNDRSNQSSAISRTFILDHVIRCNGFFRWFLEW